MDLDRGVLARTDRSLLAGLDQDETRQMVRVPVAPAKWSTWKRYCDSAGISMGRAIAALIDRELVSVFGDLSGDDSPLPTSKAEEELAREDLELWLLDEKGDVHNPIAFLGVLSGEAGRTGYGWSADGGVVVERGLPTSMSQLWSPSRSENTWIS